MLRLCPVQSGGCWFGKGDFGLSIFQTVPRQLHLPFSTAWFGLHRCFAEAQGCECGACGLHVSDSRGSRCEG